MEEEQNNGNGTNGTGTQTRDGQTPAVMPNSTTNVTTRKLAATLLGVYQKIDGKKADKVSGATNGHLAALDGSGNLADSQKTVNDFATSAQGAKADTAVQIVKMVSSESDNLKPDGSTTVIIPAAVATGTSGATPGLMTADDKKKLNEIQSGAEVNQNAFSNIQVGSTTIAADAKTDTLTISGSNHITVTGNSADDAITIGTDLSSKSALSGSDEVSLVTRGEKYIWGAKQDALAFDGTYNETSNKAATVSTVTNAINALFVSNITRNLSKSKTITALSETDGKISATASDIEIAESQVTGLVGDLALKAPMDSPALTGTPTAPTVATGDNSNKIATTEFVNNEISAKMAETDAMVYKGTIAGGNSGDYGALTPQADKGWTYKVSTAGKIDGVVVEVGDVLICNTDGTAAATSGNYNTIKNKWDFIQTNIDGAVTGPASSTKNAVAGFADTSGKKIKQLTAAEIKAAAGLDLVVNQTITVTNTSVSDGTHTFDKYVHPTTTATNAAAVKVGKDNLGHVVIGSALTKADVGLGNVVNTGDSDTPVSGGTDKFTTGGAYTELEKKVDKETGKGLSTNDYTTAEKNKLSGIAAGAEVNQNAFSNIKVGSDTIEADAKTDTVEIVGTNHVTITADTTNDKLTIETDLSSKDAASGGTAVSLVTTGEKYTWNNKASGSHTHGNITNGGALQTNDVDIASGDKIVITDASNSGKVARSPITFDASTTTTALTPKGTFEPFAKAADITTAIEGLDAAVTSSDGTNVQVKVTETDGKITAVNITTDKTEDKNNKVTSWSSTTTNTHYPSEKLVKDSLDGKSDLHHGHGNITEDGSILSGGAGEVAISQNCALVYTDNTGKIKKSTVTFDATSNYKALTQKGTFESMVKNVKLDGASSNLTNSNGTVTIPNAVATGTSGATNGLMTAADKLKLDNLDNAHLGHAYGTCSTSSNEGGICVYKIVSPYYQYMSGGIIAVYFNDIEMSAASQGGAAFAVVDRADSGIGLYKQVRYRHGAKGAWPAGVVNGGDIGYFIYNYTDDVFEFLGTDRTGVNIAYDATNKKITQTIDGVTTDVVSVSTIKSDLQLTKSDVGLGNVDNTADANKNVLSATKLTTARDLEGISFDGTKNIHRYGACSTAASSAAKTVTLSDSMVFTLATGASVFVNFTNSNTVENPTLNVNSTGAKSIKRYGTTAPGTSAKTSWQAGSVVHLVYDGTYWQMVGWLNDDSTYSNSSLGQGYGTCSTAEATVAKVVTWSNYALAIGGIVAVKFSYGLCASATLNINSKGAKNIFIKGAAVNATTCKNVLAGDIAYFIYDGTQYQFLGTDRTRADVNYNSTSKKITKTIDGVTTDVVTVSTIKSDLQLTKSDVGLGNVDNTADANKNVLSATKLTTARTIDGVSFDGSANIHHYGTCTTSGGDGAKVATLEDSMPVTITKGTVVYIKFRSENNALNPTLSVNGSAPAPIMRDSNNRAENYSKTSWNGGSVVPLMYTGDAWYIIGWLNDDTTYTNGRLTHGYGTCTPPETGTICVAMMNEGMLITQGGSFAVKFNTRDVPASASLYFNVPTSTYGFPILYRGSAIPANMIKAGDTAVFFCDISTGPTFHLVAIDRPRVDVNYDSTNKKITKTIDNVTTDVVSVATLKADLAFKNAEYGNGYGTCATAAATTTKVVTLTNYELVENGIVAVKFTYAVPSGASLNINSKGAKPIYYSGVAISGDIIQGGDIGTFVLTGTGDSAKYILLSVDRSAGEMTDQEVQDLIDALV